ncbi:DUF6056 family protein [Algoriphagus sp. C2-6-M1]|uniref:DUF6056 family protein n=1 Tax=Algoriphagus persicinus TaxID=3108754 RepID=UPI002B3D54BA|nr:DUF6056 family protein [Algoriphagus sp. C2-6-M1]MEB2782435.1 DUF6056 family protein [Algoriphagus sp. C2-6-M1]
MSKVKFDYIIFILSLLGIAVTFWIASLGWLINDDFLFITNIRKTGIISFILDFYNNWDGRQLSFPGYIQAVFHKYSVPSISFVFYLIFFYFFSYRFFSLIFDLNIKFLITICFCFLFSLFPFLKHIVFWQTGGIYVLFLLQGLFIVELYLYDYIKNKWLLLLIIILLSINSQNVIIPIGIFLIISTFYKLHEDKNVLSRDYLFFLGLALGQLIVTVAPGNFIRIQNQADAQSLYESIKFLPRLYVMMFAYAKYPIFISFLIFLYLGKFVTCSIKKLYRLIFLFTFLAFSSILLFAKFPGIAYPRTLFMFPLLSFPLGAFIGVLFSKIVNLLLSKIVLVVVNILILCFFLNQFFLVKDCSDRISLRTEFLTNHQGSKNNVIYENIRCEKVILLTYPSQSQEWQPYLEKYYNISNLIFSE